MQVQQISTAAMDTLAPAGTRGCAAVTGVLRLALSRPLAALPKSLAVLAL
jgi:hypothetical protein